jgi:hypothetical protein
MSFNIIVVIISYIIATVIHKKLKLEYNFFIKGFNLKKNLKNYFIIFNNLFCYMYSTRTVI